MREMLQFFRSLDAEDVEWIVESGEERRLEPDSDLLEWKLIHRTEEDMSRLYSKSAFGRDCTRVQFEGQGINLFAECAKAGQG